MKNKYKRYAFYCSFFLFYSTCVFADSAADYKIVREILNKKYPLKIKGKVQYNENKEVIYTSRCIRCHEAAPEVYESGHWPGYGTHQNPKSVIFAGDPKKSELYDRISRLADDSLGFMPQGLSDPGDEGYIKGIEFQAIENWIKGLPPAEPPLSTPNDYPLKDANELSSTLGDALGETPEIYGGSNYPLNQLYQHMFGPGARKYFLGRYQDLGGTCDPMNPANYWKGPNATDNNGSINDRWISDGNHLGRNRNSSYSSCEKYAGKENPSDDREHLRPIVFDEAQSNQAYFAQSVASRFTLIVRACEGYFLGTGYEDNSFYSKSGDWKKTGIVEEYFDFYAIPTLRAVQAAIHIRSLANPTKFDPYAWSKVSYNEGSSTAFNIGTYNSSSSTVSTAGDSWSDSKSYPQSTSTNKITPFDFVYGKYDYATKKMINDLKISAVTRDDIVLAYKAFHSGESPSAKVVDALKTVTDAGQAAARDAKDFERDNDNVHNAYGWKALLITLCQMPTWQVK